MFLYFLQPPSETGRCYSSPFYVGENGGLQQPSTAYLASVSNRIPGDQYQQAGVGKSRPPSGTLCSSLADSETPFSLSPSGPCEGKSLSHLRGPSSRCGLSPQSPPALPSWTQEAPPPGASPITAAGVTPPSRTDCSPGSVSPSGLSMAWGWVHSGLGRSLLWGCAVHCGMFSTHPAAWFCPARTLTGCLVFSWETFPEAPS